MDGLNNNDESMRKTTSCKTTSESLFWSTSLIGHKNIFVANQEEGVQTLLELVRNGQSSEDCFCDISADVHSDGRIQTRPG
ncbi:hypothetical protein ACROYT_G032264 [Oculina patagonica]